MVFLFAIKVSMAPRSWRRSVAVRAFGRLVQPTVLLPFSKRFLLVRAEATETGNQIVEVHPMRIEVWSVDA